jgi:cell fate (sporulation/competence/biofilm development) regulator YlbF (YheA/YmcA/DUF963 family)
MKLQSQEEAQRTLEKIALLEKDYQRIKRCGTDMNETARKLALVSLHRTINQMKEDVVRYHSHRLVSN